jgi:hypothetical protein
MKPARLRIVRVLLGMAAVALLAAVFLAYQSPHLAVDLANRVWACF